MRCPITTVQDMLTMRTSIFLEQTTTPILVKNLFLQEQWYVANILFKQFTSVSKNLCKSISWQYQIIYKCMLL